MVHGASAPTSALHLATAARNLRLSFSPTDRSVAPSPQVSFPLTSLWTRWAEARPHQRRASGMPVPRGIGSRCTDARVEWQPRQVRERGDLCTNTRKRPILGKASSGPDRNSELKQGLRCDCGQMASNTAGTPRLSGGQCWSDEALLYQVRRNGEAGARTTKIKVCVSCRALWARSTAMKCLVGETALGPAAERGVAHHQKCVRIRLLLTTSNCHCAAHCVSSPMPGAQGGREVWREHAPFFPARPACSAWPCG